MPYAPDIPDLSSQYMWKGFEERTRRKEQQAADVGQAFASLAAIGGSVAGQFKEKAALRGANEGKAMAYHEAGLMDDDTLKKIGDEKDPYKQAGFMTAFEGVIKQQQKNDYLGQQYGNAAALHQIDAKPETPHYESKVLEDGTLAWVSPTAPTIYPTDGKGGKLKARAGSDPFAGLFAPGGSAPAAPAAPPASGGGGGGGSQFREGGIYEQGGKRYRYTGGQFVPVQ